MSIKFISKRDFEKLLDNDFSKNKNSKGNKMNKIINVKLGKLNTVTIMTDDLEISKGDLFKLKHKDKTYKFKVFEIEANKDYECKITLHDIGYYDSIKKENAKTLLMMIDKTIEKVTDIEEIKNKRSTIMKYIELGKINISNKEEYEDKILKISDWNFEKISDDINKFIKPHKFENSLKYFKYNFYEHTDKYNGFIIAKKYILEVYYNKFNNFKWNLLFSSFYPTTLPFEIFDLIFSRAGKKVTDTE